MMKKILIVEDDISFGLMLETWFKKNGYDAQTASSVDRAKKMLKETSVDLLLTDLRLPDGSGIELLQWKNDNDLSCPCILMTSYAEIQIAVEAIKLGAFDFLEKPINPTLLKQKITAALSSQTLSASKKDAGADLQSVPTPHSARTTSPLQQNSSLNKSKNPMMKKIYEHIQLVAPTDISVMILGESGVGKEYVARLIHDSSRRKEAPFVAVDCGSMSKELTGSELFGHIKGSFTSAIADKTGILEYAQNGTIFLDEVGNLPHDVQVQLLRVVQERKIRPIGAVNEIEVNVRIICATNENLEKTIADGRFREDLFHRLNEFSITIPPLRERREDIADFVTYFLQIANGELQKHVEGFSPEAMSVLENYSFPGNLREMRNIIRQACLFCAEKFIQKEHLQLSEKNAFAQKPAILFNTEDEKQKIIAAIERSAGNKTLAAKILNIDRKTLYNKIHQYGLEL
ncbi:MAG: sigma-54 dependent transcriptional regulator [Bacteroidales bacterium]|nr:sigma-54 dependent transcriptional regulator [Bacteroidales bacterium]